MTESRRSHFRRNRCSFGELRYGRPDASATACLVWDVSETGAMVEVEAPEAIPDLVDLALDAAAPRPCAVARRDGRRLGLRFTA